MPDTPKICDSQDVAIGDTEEEAIAAWNKRV